MKIRFLICEFYWIIDKVRKSGLSGWANAGKLFLGNEATATVGSKTARPDTVI
jgi:hypothetical protein